MNLVPPDAAAHRGPPFRQRYPAGFEQLPVPEPGEDLLVLTPAPGTQRADEELLALDGLRAEFRQLRAWHAEARDGQVTAWDHGVAQLGGDPCRILVVLDVVQDRDQQQADGSAEVDQRADDGVGQDLRGPADVEGDDLGGLGVGEQRLAVRVDDRVVVDVDHVDRRVDFVRDLAHVALGGQPGADVEQLRDARLADQVAHHPAQERPVRHGRERRLGRELHGLGHEFPVSGEIILAAEERVVHACDIRLADVDTCNI
jgi:hypothetical protein